MNYESKNKQKHRRKSTEPKPGLSCAVNSDDVLVLTLNDAD